MARVLRPRIHKLLQKAIFIGQKKRITKGFFPEKKTKAPLRNLKQIKKKNRNVLSKFHFREEILPVRDMIGGSIEAHKS